MVTALCAGKLSFALGVVVRLLRAEQSIQEFISRLSHHSG